MLRPKSKLFVILAILLLAASGFLYLSLFAGSVYRSPLTNNFSISAQRVRVQKGKVHMLVKVVSDPNSEPVTELGPAMPICATFYNRDHEVMDWSLVIVYACDAKPSWLSRTFTQTIGEAEVEFLIPQGSTEFTISLPKGVPTPFIPLSDSEPSFRDLSLRRPSLD